MGCGETGDAQYKSAPEKSSQTVLHNHGPESQKTNF